MQKRVYFFIILAFTIGSSSYSQNNPNNNRSFTDTIIKIEMILSAFGVESDNFPSIHADVDFKTGLSICKKTFFNPAFKDSAYSLTKKEIATILEILNKTDLKKLKKEYTVNVTDQPSSTTTIYTSKQKFVIEDYGLKGEYPLQELYKIVYRY
ncbi:MAG: hypothetical protein IAF38_10580 [Bacteroidia bacterium]|nr:hypothetical protein [Bacteroidia bacterium]